MYVIATQEALCSIAQSVMKPHKEALNQLILDYFAFKDEGNQPGDQIVLVSSATLVAMHLAIFIKRKYAPYVSNI